MLSTKRSEPDNNSLKSIVEDKTELGRAERLRRQMILSLQTKNYEIYPLEKEVEVVFGTQGLKKENILVVFSSLSATQLQHPGVIAEWFKRMNSALKIFEATPNTSSLKILVAGIYGLEGSLGVVSQDTANILPNVKDLIGNKNLLEMVAYTDSIFLNMVGSFLNKANLKTTIVKDKEEILSGEIIENIVNKSLND